MTFHDETSVGAALADAYAHAMSRPPMPDTSPPDPDAAVRETIAALAAVAPSAGTAAGLLNVAAVHPVPLDPDSLTPTGEPLTSLTEVCEHWRARPADAVGVRAGVQPTGACLVGVIGYPSALRTWIGAVGTETFERRNEYGSVVHTERSYRPGPAPIPVRWAAPPTRVRSVVASGSVLLNLDQQMRRAAHGGGEEQHRAWMVWVLAPQPGRQLAVRSRRLPDGVAVTADVIPWHARRADGWTLSAPNLPITPDAPAPAWLLEAIRATTKEINQ